MRTLKVTFLMAGICAIGKFITFKFGNEYGTGFLFGVLATVAASTVTHKPKKP